VGTFGLSYPGAAQWLAAVESPPHLVAMVPAMTYSTARNFVYSGGVFDLSWMDWILNNIAPDVRVRKRLAGPKTGKDAAAEWGRMRDAVKRRLPLQDLPEVRPIAPWLFDWMKVPPGDPAWDWLEVRGKYDRVKAAVLNFSGWYDDPYGPEGAATNYLGLVASRRGEDPRAQLWLGPWVHGSVTMNDKAAQSRAGDRDFGATARIDYDEAILRFMDHYLRGIENGVNGEKPVRLFVMGENAWRQEETWPPPSAWPMDLYLRGSARGGPGRLSKDAPGEEGSSAFVSDPENPVTDPFALEAGAHDYRELEGRSDLLTFETEPLEKDLRVVGSIQAEIHLSSASRDADLWLKLFDVAPDGTAFNLMSPGLDVLRASYREGGPERKLLGPGEIVALRYENLMTGNLFARGHRIRVVLCGAFFPHFSRNLQTGELETVSAKAQKAEIVIHHDRAHPSRLTLPVLP
jgi:putative CocE/NonD family hydrolase